MSIAADEQFIQEKQASGKNIKAILNFETSLNEMVLVKVGISAVSAEMHSKIFRKKYRIGILTKRLVRHSQFGKRNYQRLK